MGKHTSFFESAGNILKKISDINFNKQIPDNSG